MITTVGNYVIPIDESEYCIEGRTKDRIKNAIYETRLLLGNNTVIKKCNDVYKLPIYFGVSNFGNPEIDNRKKGVKIDDFIQVRSDEFKFRGYQQACINRVISHYNDSFHGGIIKIPPGKGKCHGAGTMIKLFDGRVKAVENICQGDVLINELSQPVYVINTCTGLDDIYTVRYIWLDGGSNGGKAGMVFDTFTANRSHIFTVRNDDGTLSDVEMDIINGRNGIAVIDNKVIEFKIEIEYKKYDVYYGFTLCSLSGESGSTSSTSRYQLASGIITHNTFTAIGIICEMKIPTLIILDRRDAVTQWINEFKSKTNITDNDIHVINGSKNSLPKNKKIYFGVVNTVCKMKPSQLIDVVYQCIFDEIQTYPTGVYHNVFKRVSGIRYLLGMSATPKRADSCHKITELYIGPVIYETTADYEGALPIVKKIYYRDPVNYKVIKNEKTGRLDFSKMQNMISFNEGRNRLIVDLIRDLHKSNYRILAIGSRKKHLKMLHTILSGLGLSVGLYYSDKEIKDLQGEKNKDIILGIRQMTDKGLNIPELNCLMLLTTVKPDEECLNMEQLTYRILRKPHKESPLIIDIVDNFIFYSKHGHLREQYYRSKGWIVEKYIHK